MEMYIKAGIGKGQVGVRRGWDEGSQGMFHSRLLQEDSQALPPSDYSPLLDRFAPSFGHRQGTFGVQYSRIKVSGAS